MTIPSDDHQQLRSIIVCATTKLVTLFLLLIVSTQALAAARNEIQPSPPASLTGGGVDSGGASVQQSATASVPSVPLALKPNEVEAFLAPLSDRQTRQLLIANLKRITTERQHQEQLGQEASGNRAAGFVQVLQHRAEEIVSTWNRHQDALTAIPAMLRYVFGNLTNLRGFAALSDGALALVAMLAFGSAVAWAFARVSRHLEQRMDKELALDHGWLRVLYHFAQLLLGLVKVGLFTVGAYGVSFLFFDQYDPMRYLATTCLLIITSIWTVALLSHFFFAPRNEHLRLISMPNIDAISIHNWLIVLSAFIFLAFFSNGLLAILGLRADLLRLYEITCGAIVVGLLLTWAWVQRWRVSDKMLSRLQGGGRGNNLAVSMAQNWHIFATVYLLVLWSIWASNILLQWDKQAAAAVYSLLVLFVLPFVDYFFGGLMALLLRNRARDCEAQARVQAFVNLLRRSLRLVLVVVAAIVLLSAWSNNLNDMVRSEMGSIVFQAAINIGATLLLAFIAWEAVKIFIDPHIPKKPREGILDLEGEGGVSGGTRSETLLPLFRSFICIILVSTVVMIVLSSVGVDIAPLLAGAGVIGLAVGFGAQKLVQDIISGIFFLVDDAFRIGEYVEAEKLRGTVESISLRSMKLRHHLGMVQTIPFGDIQAITNHSRDWIIMKLEFRMAYDTNIEKVRKVIKKVGQDMQQDPVFGKHMLQPLKSQGVLRMEESTLIMRMKFTSVPGQQWVMRREAYRRVQEAFRDNGFEFAYRKVFVEAIHQQPALASEEPISDGHTMGAAVAIAQNEPPAVQGQKAP